MSEKLPKISIFTLGCKVNQYDTDAMLAIFEHAGFEIAEGLEFADVYVVNSCAVTAEAEKKSRQSVARILKVNPNAKIFVCGCASQNNFSQFAKTTFSTYREVTENSVLQEKSSKNTRAKKSDLTKSFPKNSILARFSRTTTV